MPLVPQVMDTCLKINRYPPQFAEHTYPKNADDAVKIQGHLVLTLDRPILPSRVRLQTPEYESDQPQRLGVVLHGTSPE